jgi:multidrug efflux pump
VENIHRHIEDGLSPMAASLQGARELGGPVIAMTITLAAVYAPIGFQGGLTGALFREFAFTLAGSVIVSGVVALTLSPMMCSRLLRHDDGQRQRFAHFLDQVFDKVRWAYESLLHATLQYRPVVVVFGLIVFASLVPFYQLSKADLAPDEDQGMIVAFGTASPNANIDQLARYSDQITEIVRQFPETAHIVQVNGYPASNNNITLLALKPWDARPRTTMQLLPEVTQKLGAVAGMRMLSFLQPPLPGAGGANVQYIVVSTDDPMRIAQVADALTFAAVQSGLFFYADSSLKFDQAQAYIDVDRDKAAMLGISMAQLGADLGAMLGGNYVNFFNVQGRSYRVIPQVDRAFRLTPEQLGDYYVHTAKGAMVPVSAVATIRYQAQPRALSRFQQLNAATITCVPKPGVTQGQALDFLNAKARELFPEGYTADYAGQSRQYMQESGTFLLTMGFAVIIIFLVLAAQFESFRDPLIIMLSVPLAISGALAFVCLGFHGLSLNIYTKVGLITLVGLVTKHGILITQFANQLQHEGKSRREAVEDAAGVRLRPILMTTAAMVLGVMPLVFASGAGAVSRQHMGLIIATGMSVGTLFTLFVVPAAYTLLARDHQHEAASPVTATTTASAREPHLVG